MRIGSAVAGSAIFFLVVPGTVAGVLPWLLTGGYADRLPNSPFLAVTCIVVIACAIAILLYSFAHFALKGRGTPAPIAPTENLVVSGPYRFVRNPMYVAVLTIIFAQALLFGSSAVLIYGLIIAAAVVSFTRFYEEPKLSDTHGASYEHYRAAVPGWWPRFTPWQGQ
ncbi:MAG: isoprenylcysteine carboxylmethyltransferase family protein [Rhizobiaceae bacterium]